MAFIAVVDYDSGNVRSVSKAFEFVGAQTSITNNPQTILKADGVILPGQGAFGDCMRKLNLYGLNSVILDFISSGRPFLGICVGLQLLFEKSFEFGEHNGFGIIRGNIQRFPKKEGYPVPHMGWNTVDFTKQDPLFHDVESNSYFYFVHSYYAKALDGEIATTDYILSFTSAVRTGNVWAVQFHPEKSQDAGLKVVDNFHKICEGKL